MFLVYIFIVLDFYHYFRVNSIVLHWQWPYTSRFLNLSCIKKPHERAGGVAQVEEHLASMRP
jgi:hypothetical protein